MAYLALPLVIFLLGFLKLWLGLPLLTALAAASFSALKNWSRQELRSRAGPAQISPGSLLAALVFLFAVLCTTGAGGIGPRNWDWMKHDAVLKDLIEQSWPVRYSIQSETITMVYYVAYYLPAAVVGKVAGWKIANLVLFSWTFLGAVLALLWTCALSRGRVWMCSIVLVGFSGMDVIGALAGAGHGHDLARVLGDRDLEWWAVFWQYSSNVSLLYFVPHQAMAGWLLTALILDCIDSGYDSAPILWLLSLSLLWSPFVTIGLLPLCGAYLTGNGATFRRLSGQASVANLVGTMMLGVLLLYFQLHFYDVHWPDFSRLSQADRSRGEFYLFAARHPLTDLVGDYLLFILCEFALLAIAAWAALRALPKLRSLNPVFCAATLTLVSLPFFHYGVFNDLVMRTSIPALFTLQIILMRILAAKAGSWPTVAVVLLLSLGILHSANLIRMKVMSMTGAGRIVFLRPESAVKDLFGIQKNVSTWDFAGQYVGTTDHWFVRCCMADSVPRQVQSGQRTESR